MLVPSTRHRIDVMHMIEANESSIVKACSEASLKRLASLKTGKKQVMFVLASNTKEAASLFKAALSCSSFDGVYFMLSFLSCLRIILTRPLQRWHLKRGERRMPMATLDYWKAAMFSELRMLPMQATISPSS